MQRVFGKRVYQGTVVSFDICNKTGKNMYHVCYTDGDEEDLYEEQLRPLLHATSARGTLTPQPEPEPPEPELKPPES